MVSTTEWQADAGLWKDDVFFDAGTFCLPSISPQASLEAYTVVYDLKTGIHDVFLTMKGILGLSASSTSSQSSHVAEFSNGVMKAVLRRRDGGDLSGFPTEDVNNGVGGCEPHSPAMCEAISADQQATSSPAYPEADAPVDVPKEGDSSSNMISNTESSEEPIANSDNLGIINSNRKCPKKANSLNILTNLVSEDDYSPLSSSASDTSSDNSANTRSKPVTAGTSPTFSLAEDLLEPYARQAEASTTIIGLDLQERPILSKPWHLIPLQWLDMAISDRQYCHWDEIQGKEEPESVQEDQIVDLEPRYCSPAEVEGQLRLQNLDLYANLGQSATELDVEGSPEEAIAPNDEAVAEDGDYQPCAPECHHLNLLGNPVYQASHTPSAVSLWVAMASKKKAPIGDLVSLKAVVSSQASKWVDPVLLEEGVSVPEEIMKPGNATAYRSFLTGLTKIQYEPCGTWQWETRDYEHEIPCVVNPENKIILDEAYNESYGYPGLQRPFFIKEHDLLGLSFPCPQLKKQKGWESPEKLGDSNLRFVLDEESITRWHDPAASSTYYEAAELAEVQEVENDNVEKSLVFPADESALDDTPDDDDEADARFQKASSLRSLLALSMTREAMWPSNEGRFFTPRIREDSEDFDDYSDSLDGEAWETDENGAFVSPKKGKERLRCEMGEDPPRGIQRAEEDSLGLSQMSLGRPTSPEAQGDMVAAFTICHYVVADLPPTGMFGPSGSETGTTLLTNAVTEAENALPTPVGEPLTQEGALQVELCLPYCKYNDLSEIPLRLNLVATVGRAVREAGRWFTENMLW